MHPLDSAWLKFKWAERHLDLLSFQQTHFYDQQPIAADSTDESKDPERKIRPKGFVPPPVHEWSMIVGDAVHNMRCVLDHIAYALAVKHLNALGQTKKPSRNTKFPLLQSHDPKAFKNAVAEIEPAARSAIDALQPYNRRNPLWILSVLDNADKHHRVDIHPAQIAAQFTLGSDAVRVNLADGTVTSHDPVTGEPTEELHPSAAMSVSLLIGIPGESNKVPDSVLREIHVFISQSVFPAFDLFFRPTTSPTASPVAVNSGDPR